MAKERTKWKSTEGFIGTSENLMPLKSAPMYSRNSPRRSAASAPPPSSIHSINRVRTKAFRAQTVTVSSPSPPVKVPSRAGLGKLSPITIFPRPGSGPKSGRVPGTRRRPGPVLSLPEATLDLKDKRKKHQLSQTASIFRSTDEPIQFQKFRWWQEWLDYVHRGISGVANNASSSCANDCELEDSTISKRPSHIDNSELIYDMACEEEPETKCKAVNGQQKTKTPFSG
ncbi:Ubiquitin carboxyl-terminal hydrolase 5 [Nymphaea thermarum]|nr:Ubiquitin carboxyl-terminal hydrolase 5 [Nymphaea thermarum]